MSEDKCAIVAEIKLISADGTYDVVYKSIPAYDDEKLVLYTFQRRFKEAWRDYLYFKYGENWREHDPSEPGSFWKCPPT